MVNKEQKNIIIETSDFRFELKKYTPLTILILCKISDRLKQDAEERESVEKPVEIDMQEIVKPEIITQDKISDPFEAPFEEILHKYRNAVIYKEIYDHLLETLPDKFNYKNVYDSIDSIYKEKPKRELKHKTLQTYTGRYIDYMKMNKKIKIDKKSGMFVKIIQEEIIEAPDDVWTEDEDEIMIKYYPGMTAPTIKLEKLPHRSEQAIYDRALFLKIQKLKRREKEPEKQRGRIALFPKEEILAKYNTVSIYKPIVDEIMDDENIPDEFTRKDLIQFLFNYHKHVLKKKISMASSTVYSGKYVMYLIENNLIKEQFSEGKIPNKLIKIKDKKLKEEPPEKEDKKEPTDEKQRITIKAIDDVPKKPELTNEEKQQPVSFADGDTLDEAIYNYAVRYKWVNMPSIPMLTIERHFPESTSDEIKTAFSKLIDEGKADQIAPGRIKFKMIDA